MGVKYEYDSTDSVTPYPQDLIERGLDGWELCSIIRKETGIYVFYFKRIRY